MSAGDDIERVREWLATAPSGKTNLKELRDFAAEWEDSFGPMAGRDVTRLCDDLASTLAALGRLQGRLAATEETLEAIRGWADHSRGFHEGSVLDRIYFAADAALESRP